MMRKKTISLIRTFTTHIKDEKAFKEMILGHKELKALYVGEVKTFGLENDPQYNGKVWKGFSADQIASHLYKFRTNPLLISSVPIEEKNTDNWCKCD